MQIKVEKVVSKVEDPADKLYHDLLLANGYKDYAKTQYAYRFNEGKKIIINSLRAFLND